MKVILDKHSKRYYSNWCHNWASIIYNIIQFIDRQKSTEAAVIFQILVAQYQSPKNF